jgi:hypothetical protein
VKLLRNLTTKKYRTYLGNPLRRVWVEWGLGAVGKALARREMAQVRIPFVYGR